MAFLLAATANELRRRIVRKQLREGLVEVVNLGYRQAARKVHPDAGGSKEGMQRLSEAKAILMRFAENY